MTVTLRVGPTTTVVTIASSTGIESKYIDKTGGCYSPMGLVESPVDFLGPP